MPRVTEAHVQARLKEIGDAAYRVFRRKGFTAATMQDIASEADLSIGALYHYFDSKEAIINAVAEDVRERMIALIAGPLSRTTDTRERVREVIDANFGRLHDPVTLQNFGIVASYFAEAPRNPEIAASLVETGRVGHELLRPLWQDARDRGEIDPEVDIDALTFVTMALREGLWMYMLAGPMNLGAFMDAAEAVLTGRLWLKQPSEDGEKERRSGDE